MGNALRKLERGIIKDKIRKSGNSVKKSFKDAWLIHKRKKSL